MATPDSWQLLAAVGLGGPLIGAVITYFGVRVTAKPSAEQALTERFKALVDRLETERTHLETEVLKLDRVAHDLEVMVVHLLAWAEQAVDVAKAAGVTLPERPKLHQLSS